VHKPVKRVNLLSGRAHNHCKKQAASSSRRNEADFEREADETGEPTIKTSPSSPLGASEAKVSAQGAGNQEPRSRERHQGYSTTKNNHKDL